MAHKKGTAHQWTSEQARAAGSIGGKISRGGRGRLIGALFVGLLLPIVGNAQEQCITPYAGGPEICVDPAAPPVGTSGPPITLPTCPGGYLVDPYTRACYTAATRAREPMSIPLYRPVSTPKRGEAFSVVIEQGPAVPLETLGLRRPAAPDSLLWYQRSTGSAWLVLHNLYAPDCILEAELAPNLNLIAIDMDKDGNDDLLGHDTRSGAVYRFYTRSFGSCGGQ